MANLQNCASVFQLGFGVDAIVPALYFAFRRTQDSLADRLAYEIQKKTPEFYKTEKEVEVLRAFVFNTVPFVKWSYRLRIVPVLFLTIGLVASFFGLVLSAVEPNYDLPNPWVWTFSVYTLLFCPATYFSYRLLLKGLERLWTWKWTVDPGAAQKFVEAFELHYDHAKFMNRHDIRSALLLAQRREAESARRDLKHWAQDRRDRVLRFFRLHR
jgi:hypothetical protein